MNRNQKPFDLQQAIADHPLCTRDNRPAKFIAYVPEALQGFNLVIMIDGIIHAYPDDGKPNNNNFHLFLAPLGYCEGLPVWPGDKLTGIKFGTELIANTGHNNFEMFKWPSKLPVVETRMTERDLAQIENSEPVFKDCLKAIANKAISRAIADGDVIPTSLFVKLAGEAYNERVESREKSFKDTAQSVLDNYLEGLK